MKAFERKIALRVLGVHLAIVFALMLFSALRGCFRPRPKPEIVTFIEFGQPAEPVQVEPVNTMPEP
ncbi:MAG: hypothetical protein KJN98_08070, partial [Pontiella sp.]|nr:hypothetical protein [Pontiella sp.]